MAKAPNVEIDPAELAALRTDSASLAKIIANRTALQDSKDNAAVQALQAQFDSFKTNSAAQVASLQKQIADQQAANKTLAAANAALTAENAALKNQYDPQIQADKRAAKAKQLEQLKAQAAALEKELTPTPAPAAQT